MHINLLTCLIVISVGILLLNILILTTLQKLKKTSKETNLSYDKNYLDLNLKFQLLLTTLIMAGVTITFLGWNVKSQISQELKKEILSDIKIKIDTINSETDTLKTRINETNDVYSVYKKKLNSIEEKYVAADKNYKLLNDETNKRISNIKTLLSIYVVADIPVKINDMSKPIRFVYSKMKPLNSQNLPEFKKPPLINIQPSAGALAFSITNITKDFIEIVPTMITMKNLDSNEMVETKLTFWLVERE